jgi:nucleotide-binding universal stress UspA family protein
MFKKMLVPVDGSEISLRAVRTAAQMAKADHAELVLLHVAAPFVFPYGYDPGMFQSTSENIYNQRVEEGAKQLLDRAKDHAGPDLVVHTQWIMSDRTEEAIVKAAKSEACDVIVIATHGRGAVGRALLGSVTSRLLPLSPVPVLVYRDASMVA